MALCVDDTFTYTSIAVNTSNIRRGTAIDWLVFAMFVMCLKQALCSFTFHDDST